MPIDHYTNRGNDTTATYKMRYLLDETYIAGGIECILFYAGNEGGVYTFYDNSGFMTTTLAEKYKGLVVVGEHRYFGTSMPYGDQSYDKEHLVYLTVE